MMLDTDPMPWGAYKGTPIGQVPFENLWRLYKKQWLSGDVLAYFEKQLRELQASEQRMADLGGKKPKQYLIENYECRFPGKKSE